VPSAITLVRWVNENAFVSETQTRPCPTFGRPVHLGGLSPSITARYFSAGPSDSTSRWTPCPPKYSKRWLQVGLGCIQLSPSCPFRPLHTFRFLRPARLRTPLLGYGAPHLSARGTSTLLNNALLSAHFLQADLIGIGAAVTRRPPSRPGEFRPEPLTEPDVNLSIHPARATPERLPPCGKTMSSSGYPLTQSRRG
jgi:hypothetical protein